MSNIVILGSSFAALSAIKTLRKHGCRDNITVVSPQDSLFYYPSLIWVPAGLRNEAALTVPLDNFFRKNRVDFYRASVTGLDPQGKTVQTNQGEVKYADLIIASGGRFIKKLPGIEHIYTPCEGYGPTQAYSDRFAKMERGILAFGFGGNPNEPAGMRGGPMFEFLFGMDTLLRQQGRRDKFDLVFFSPAPQPGKRLGEQAVTALLGEMERRNIRTHLGHKLKGFAADKVLTEGGDFASDLTLFMPGMTGPAWLEKSGLPLSPGGFIQADEHCRVPGFEHVFVAGDSGSFPGPDWMPKQAHISDLQAVAAAKNLLDVRQGQPATHTYKVELICIVDSLNSGTLIYRDLTHGRMFKSFTLHWAKRFFEWWYLRRYR
jgi:sulfide:quinone oxidoreductase